jgi:hypothetical protein
MVRHCTCVPTVERVCVMKRVEEQVTVPVTTHRCVPECVKQTCTVMVPHQVTYEATRNVMQCVPTEEKVTCCRMVCHTVEKQVPCEAPCANTCCESHCGPGLFERIEEWKHSLFSHHGCGCETSCGCH